MKHKIPVPTSMQVQFAKLFGEACRESKSIELTDLEWRHILARVIDELRQYLDKNIETDGLHRLMLESGLWAANESLKDDEFFPGYIEGITRFALLLMGDYPDHKRYKSGRKKSDHYKLNFHRTSGWSQDIDQKFRTLLVAGRVGFPLDNDPEKILGEFRDQYGFKASYKDFLNWYKQNYPKDYAKLF